MFIIRRFKAECTGVLCVILFMLIGCAPNSTEQNSKPKISLVTPSSGAVAQDTSFYFEWSASDADNDNLTYDLYFDSTYHSSVSWPIKGRNLNSVSYKINDLKFNKKYYWRVCVKDGKDSTLSSTYDFTTKMQPITKETFFGLWKEDGYVGDSLTYHFILLLNSNMTFTFTEKRASDDYQLDSYSGTFLITSNTTIKFDYTATSYEDAYFTYSFLSSRNTLYLTHVSGYDFMNSKVGTKWSYTRQ